MQTHAMLARYSFCLLFLWMSLLGTQKRAEATPSNDANDIFELTILYTSDLYGQLRDFQCRRKNIKDYQYTPPETDLANLLYQVRRIRKEIASRHIDINRDQDPRPLLFNTGDNLGTSLAARFLLEFEGLSGVEFIAETFRQFLYDLIGIGNHEFSVPPDKLQNFLRQAALFKDLRFSAANLALSKPNAKPEDFEKHPIARYINKDGSQRVPAFVFEQLFRRTTKQIDPTTKQEKEVTREEKIKVGVFHVVPNEMEKKVTASTVDGLKFEDPGSKASEVATWLRETKKVDVVIMLSHLEEGKSKGAKVKEVLSSASGIDLVITNELRDDGKATFTGTFDKEGKGVYIVGGVEFGGQLGRVRLRVLKKPKKAGEDPQLGKVLSAQIDSIPLQKNNYDRNLRRDLIKWESSYCRRWGEPLGVGKIREKYKMTHEQFAKYTLNLMREKTRAEVAIINKGAIREKPFGSEGLQGYVTKDDLYRALPFNEKIEVLRVKASVLSDLGSKSEKFFFAGLDGSQVNGRSLDEERTYSVVTIGYVANGREGGFEKKYIRSREVFRYESNREERLRDMMIYHFASNGFRLLPRAEPVKPLEKEAQEGKPKPPPDPVVPFKQSDDEIPFNGEFVNLADKPAFKFTSKFELSFRSIFLGPINIGTFYQQKDTLTGGFYEKYAGTGNIELMAQVDTRAHLWITKLQIQYGVDVSRQWSPGPPPQPDRAVIFQESDDRITFRTEYRFRYFEALYPNKQRWFFTNPFIEAQFGSEMTRGSRPDLEPKDAFERLGVTEIFYNSEFVGKVGFSFTPFKDYLFNERMQKSYEKYNEEAKKKNKAHIDESWNEVDLNLKIGFAWRQQFAFALVRKEGTAGVVNTDPNLGLSVEYELKNFRLFKIGETPVTFDSKAEYLLTFIVSPVQEALYSHDLAWENKINIQIVGGLRLSLGVRFLVYAGFFRRDPNDQASKLEQGPIAFRVDPNVSLGFDWGARAQAY